MCSVILTVVMSTRILVRHAETGDRFVRELKLRNLAEKVDWYLNVFYLDSVNFTKLY